MNDVTFNILKFVVSVCLALISAFLIPYIKARLEDERYKKLVDIVKVAVYAAEQTIGAGHGAVKKDEVITFVTKWMANNGIKITEEQLSEIIESIVFAMNKEIK